MLSEEQIRRYLESGGTTCPECGDETHEGIRSPEVTEGGMAEQEVICVACGATWYDDYKLVGVRSK